MQFFDVVIDSIASNIAAFGSRRVAFGVAFGIIGCSLAIYLWFTWRAHRRFVSEIYRATKSVTAAARDPKLSPEDRIAKVDHGIARSKVVGPAWTAYRQGLRPNPNSRDTYVNLVDPHSWFALERMPGRGYEKWASTMAGVSLTVGLLFTFVGLTAALFQVGDAGADTARLRVAIAKILEISSAKFITSMAGIVAYIGWTLVARAHASRQAKLALTFATEVQHLTSPMTPEAILLDQLDQTREQSSRLKTLADDMAVAFDTSLNKVLGQRLDSLPAAVENSIRPVVQAINDMGTSIGAGNHAALEGMINGLVTGVHESTGNEMQALVAAMRGAADELAVAKSGIGASGAEFSELLTRAAQGMEASASRMADAMERRASEIDGRMQRIDEVLSAGAARMDGIGAAMSDQLQNGLMGALDTIGEATQAGATAARERATAELGPVLDGLKGLMGDMRTSADESRVALTEGGRSAAQDLGAALHGAGTTLSDASNHVSDTLRRSFEEATAAMVGAVQGSVDGYRAATDALSSRLTLVERSFESLDQSVRANVGQLGQASGALTAAGRTLGQASDQVERAAAPVLSSLQVVQEATTSTRDTLRLLQETSSSVAETATAMSASSQAAASAFRSYEERFATVDESLGRTVATMRDGIIELGTRVTEVVGSYDEHLGRAVGQLRTGVGELAEALEDFRAGVS